MMKIAVAALLAGSAAANRPMKANSKAAGKLLSKARRADGTRRLEDEMGSWAASYSLHFEKCAVSTEYFNYGNNDNNENRGMYGQRLVHFKLCPSNACGDGCEGPDYVVDMFDFLEGYVQYQQEAMEQQCECVKENCYCNGDDEDACEYQCYVDAGIYEYCAEDNNNNNNGQEEIELEEAVQCADVDVDEDALAYYYYNNQDGGNNNYYNGNNNNNMELFVGPYCSDDGTAILLGTFMEETCSVEAPEGIYEGTHYGQALPYSSVSIVSGECISCLDEDDDDQCNQYGNYNYYNNNNNGNNNNNNNGEEPEVNEFCGRLYEDAGKCEGNMDANYNFYPNNYACDFIEGLSASQSVSATVSDHFSKISATPKVLATVFGLTTAVFGGMAYYFHSKVSKANTGLGAGLVKGNGNLA